MNANWTPVSLLELVRTAFGSFIANEQRDARISIGGPRVLLEPQAAVNLLLALHEPATNAAKYGALSNESGEISVAWDTGPSTADPPARLELIWRERAGPPVAPPAHRGFGSRLARGVAHELGGEGTLRFQPEGLECRFEVPPSERVRLG
jgi:two-component sensor histidine kinase